MEPQIRYTTTEDGASIAYAVMGAGPAVIMTPAMHSFAARWRLQPGQRELCERIADQFKLVLYDGRGMGLSSREHRDYGLDARMRDLETVIDAVDVEEFSLFGPIYGGFVAVSYSARHADRVTRLVLYTSISSGARWFTETPGGRFNAALGSVTAEQWEQVSEAIAMGMAATDRGPEAVRLHGLSLRETWHAADFLVHREAIRKIDVTVELALVSAPTLVIATEGGVFEHSRELATAIPHARLHRMTTRWNTWGDEQDYATLLTFLGGEARAASPITAERAAVRESSVRTVLFTDLVGHTAMMQRLGDARGREVLREHERITRETLRAHGGTEIKTDGDSFMVSFGSVTSAVECAVALQRRFAAWNEERADSEKDGAEGASLRGAVLDVRMGLNAGEPIEDGGDLFGATVILASRIKEQAGAGEILIPETVRGLLSGKGFVFADRGEFLPKGFEDGVRLFEVRWRE